MKRNTFIAIVIGLVVVCAVAVVALNMKSLLPPGSNTAAPPTTSGQTKADVLEKFDALKTKVNASGMWFGGASRQNVKGIETAMVYLYEQSGVEQQEQLAVGFNALYSVFEMEDPLLVGLVDTSQRLNSQQYKVDVYSLNRPLIELFVEGDVTKAEMLNKAIYVTPDNANTLINNSTEKPSASPLPNRPRNFTPPADRQKYLTDYMNETSYKPVSVQAGSATDGEKVVNLVLRLPANSTDALKYDELDTGMKACSGAYGDYDRYFITLAPQAGSEYLVTDVAATPVFDYLGGDISQYQLYENMNLTYYTR
ncbi:MAG TPA: hypothetical protein VGK13_02115 [Methanocellaceae archaeon]